MTDTPRFKINGTEYQIPLLDSFTIDECGIFHEWTHVHVEEIEDTPVNSMMIAAFMQIAYMRGNPQIPAQVARSLVGQSNLVEAMTALQDSLQEHDARPPELPKSEHEPSAPPTRSASSPSTSGVGSTTHSDTPASDQTAGGTPQSGISVTSGQLRSVG